MSMDEKIDWSSRIVLLPVTSCSVPNILYLCGALVFAVWCCIELIEHPIAFGISHFICGFKVIPQIPFRLNVTPCESAVTCRQRRMRLSIFSM